MEAEQLNTSELKTRELAEQYLKIQENTEYLTNLVKYAVNKNKVCHKTEVNTPDLESIAALTVQLSYLLFTCYVKKVNVRIGKRNLLANPQKRELNPKIYREYILQKDFQNLREEEQNLISQTFTEHQFSTAINSMMKPYERSTINYVKQMIELAKPLLTKTKGPNQKLIKQFQHLDSIKTFLQARFQSIQHPRIVILSLEESEIFREHSLLVKVMNNSIFSAIRNSKSSNVFGKIYEIELNLQKLKSNRNQTGSPVFQLEMEAAVESLMCFLIKVDIITAEQSINGLAKLETNLQSEQAASNMRDANRNPKVNQAPINKLPPQMQPNQQMQSPIGANNISKSTKKQYVLGQVQGTTFEQRKYFCRIQVSEKNTKQFNAKVFERVVFEALNNYRTSEQDQKTEIKPANYEQAFRNDYLIEYLPSKNLLSVKYITSIELNIQNTDLIMFQCNNIAYHWSNVSMELAEKTPNKPTKRKERYLALKTVTHLHMTERPLFRLLLMMDLVMLCAKIAQPELKRNTIKPDDYHHVQEISLKVDHMINLFICKIEKYYKMVAETENTNKEGL